MAQIVLMLVIFAVTSVASYLLIAKVPQRLHTPLMSFTNAISGVTILGALLLFDADIAASANRTLFGGVALAFAAFNVVGGFAVTQRMLGMFKGSKAKRGGADA